MSSTSTNNNGISGDYSGDNETIYRALTAFTAIAWYNAAELIVLVLVVFKKYTGLYFWSLLITSIAVIPYSIGAWMKLVSPNVSPYISVSFLSLSWMVMVPGQSFVLYSRLHLITQNQKLLRAVFWMIIIDAIILCIPTAVLTYGTNSNKPALFLHGYQIMEKIQMTCFVIQELIISSIYLYEIRRILGVVYEGGTRQLMYELLIINVIIIGLDVALITVEYLNLYEIETVFKGMVYTIKLKLEFGVLSKLVKVVTANHGPQRVTSFAHEMNLKHTSHAQAISSPLFSGRRPSARRESTRSGITGAFHLEHAPLQHAASVGSFATSRNASIVTPTTLPSCEEIPARPRSLSESYPGKLV
ncbi:MAG: hypothetical protein M1828_005394 [Chrysothrix sp. TS-e1954]|nr:MAG: hypothetical protein M1828_005394 [Chrysothrix sp. TS-e1954]